MHVGSVKPADEVFKPIIEHVEQNGLSWEDVDESPERDELAKEYATPQAFLSFAREEANTEIETSTEHPVVPSDFAERKNKWLSRFKAIAPMLLRGGLTVGSAVVSSYVSKSPIVAGLEAGFAFAQKVASD